MAEWTPKTGRALSMEPPPAALRGEEDPPAAPAAWAPKTGRALPADLDAEPKHGITTSMIRSASDMVMPFTDEIAGAAGAGLNALASVPKRVLSADFRGMGDNMAHDYRYIRDAARRDQAEGEQEHPVATTIAKGAGLALGALAPLPGLRAGAGASAAARYAAGAGTAAGYGALNAFGASDAADLSGNLKDAAVGGASGAVLHGVGQGAGALLSKARGTMARFAALRMSKASGLDKAAYMKLGSTAPQAFDEAAARGRALLDAKAGGLFSSTADIAERLQPITAEASQRVGRSIDALDQAAGGARVAPNVMADRVEQRIAKPLLGHPATEDMAPEFFKQAGRIRAKPTMTFEEAEALKRGYDPNALFGRGAAAPAPVRAQGYRGVRQAVKEEVERQAQAVSPELAQEFIAAKRQYGLLKPSEAIASKRAMALEGNRALSPTDYAAVIAGAAGHGGDGLKSGLWGLATGVAHKLVRERGSSFTAVSVDALQKAIASGALGKFGDRLSQAVSRGISLPVAHALLLKADPAYGQAVEQAMGQQP